QCRCLLLIRHLAPIHVESKASVVMDHLLQLGVYRILKQARARMKIADGVALGHDCDAPAVMPAERHCEGEGQQQAEQGHASVRKLDAWILAWGCRRALATAPTKRPCDDHACRKTQCDYPSVNHVEGAPHLISRGVRCWGLLGRTGAPCFRQSSLVGFR